MSTDLTPLVRIENLNITFNTGKKSVKAVDGVNLNVKRG
jgi:ABC-type dipeptide/oligopeptide/nickel transport system ATPase component